MQSLFSLNVQPVCDILLFRLTFLVENILGVISIILGHIYPLGTRDNIAVANNIIQSIKTPTRVE